MMSTALPLELMGRELLMQPTRRYHRSAGYTLAGMMVVVMLLGLAATTAMRLWSTTTQRSEEAEFVYRIERIRKGLKVFMQSKLRVPKELNVLVDERLVRPQDLLDPITDQPWAVVLVDGMHIKDVHGTSPKLMFRAIKGKRMSYAQW